MSKKHKSPVSSETTFQPFKQAPTVKEFVNNIQRASPPIGSSPEQVRTHYQSAVPLPSGSSHAAQEHVEKESSCATDLVDTRTAQQYQNQEIPVFHSSDTGISVELPSQFVEYPFKELYIHPFKGKHLAKMSRAAKEKSARLMAEVLSSVLEVPGQSIGGLAFQLTLPDYYWLLYFQRKSCYTKVTFNHTTRCRNRQHIQDVLDDKKKPDSLLISAVIDTTKLQTTNFVPFEVDPELQELGAHCPTVGDFVLSLEDPRFGELEYDYAAQIACLIYPNASWEYRINQANEMSAPLVEKLKEYERAVTSYGVKETAIVTCKDCGASNETVLSIDASSFLPAA